MQWGSLATATGSRGRLNAISKGASPLTESLTGLVTCTNGNSGSSGSLIGTAFGGGSECGTGGDSRADCLSAGSAPVLLAAVPLGLQGGSTSQIPSSDMSLAQRWPERSRRTPSPSPSPLGGGASPADAGAGGSGPQARVVGYEVACSGGKEWATYVIQVILGGEGGGRYTITRRWGPSRRVGQRNAFLCRMPASPSQPAIQPGSQPASKLASHAPCCLSRLFTRAT
jgi:hypothetical protein